MQGGDVTEIENHLKHIKYIIDRLVANLRGSFAHNEIMAVKEAFAKLKC